MSLLSQISSSLRPFLVSSLTYVKHGKIPEAHEIYHNAAAHAMSNGTSPELYARSCSLLDRSAMHHDLPDEVRQEVEKSRVLIQQGSAIINGAHNQLIHEDPEYRDLFHSAVVSQTRRDLYTDFSDKTVIGVRGMQDHAPDDPNSFAKPATQFNVYSTTLLASGGQKHNGGGLVVARINDPAIVTPEEVAAKVVGWTKGFVCYSYCANSGAKYAMRDFPGVPQKTNGFLYFYASKESISMDQHMYRQLSPVVTSGARHNYEFITPVSTPTMYVGAIPVYANGQLGEFIRNPNADSQAVKAFERLAADDESVGALLEGSARNQMLADLQLETKANTAVAAFEEALPETEKEHMERFETRKTTFA